ncbi:hypothetical protein [Niveibacterium sp. COAC-50]|uniref:hypothetical protein n=1 Tax=Niveibacterium sp. COAC-50 TaxID=2729384 RepID=UPI0015578591|nr:hypothetical protein [Niveibacterium sp. COAC-50]
MNTPKKLDPKLREMLVNIAKTGANHLDARAEAVSEHNTDLHEMYERLIEQPAVPFKPGMLVRWKPGLRNKRWPQYNEAAIVVAVLPEPILDDTKDAGFTYFREPLDVILGVRDPDHDLLLFHFDSRRFEPLP